MLAGIWIHTHDQPTIAYANVRRGTSPNITVAHELSHFANIHRRTNMN